MAYDNCPLFSEDAIAAGEFHQQNTTLPLGKPCYSCEESKCLHNSIRM